MPGAKERNTTRRSRSWLIVAIGLVAVFLALPWLVRALLWRWEQSPVLRGRQLAAAQGCFTCHLPDGGTEIPNPGSRWGTVPRFRAGNAMMYASNRDEVEQFIRFGAPRVWLDDSAARARLASQPLRMPAYGDRLSDQQIADLVAYATAAEGVDLPAGDPADAERIAAGRSLARARGCTSCHGVEGSGGLPNPGSLGGFIPGFRGRNFRDLVRDRAEFDEWVRTGTSSRLAKNPLVRMFWRRQTIAMPAYRETLEDQELDQLWAWITAVRTESPAP